MSLQFWSIFSIHPIFTYISSFFTGLLNPAVVFLTSYTILNLYHTAYKNLWSIATLGFAITQLIGGLCFSALQHWVFHIINNSYSLQGYC
jgi:hypothetical protein